MQEISVNERKIAIETKRGLQSLMTALNLYRESCHSRSWMADVILAASEAALAAVVKMIEIRIHLSAIKED
jgi:hypothetical protein